ncbi:MAG TPA: hypothetical protein VGB62_10780 [Allosphingosinicella sp.]
MQFLHPLCLPLQLSIGGLRAKARASRAKRPPHPRGIYVHIIDKARAGISSAAVQIVILAALFV